MMLLSLRVPFPWFSHVSALFSPIMAVTSTRQTFWPSAFFALVSVTDHCVHRFGFGWTHGLILSGWELGMESCSFGSSLGSFWKTVQFSPWLLLFYIPPAKSLPLIMRKVNRRALCVSLRDSDSTVNTKCKEEFKKVRYWSREIVQGFSLACIWIPNSIFGTP